MKVNHPFASRTNLRIAKRAAAAIGRGRRQVIELLRCMSPLLAQGGRPEIAGWQLLLESGRHWRGVMEW